MNDLVSESNWSDNTIIKGCSLDTSSYWLARGHYLLDHSNWLVHQWKIKSRS